MIREAFFHYNWKKEEAEPLSILIHQGGSPIKGLHILLDALKIVKKYYPNFKLYISGDNIFSKKGLIKKLKESSYTNIIKRRIIKYNLLQNIYYTGYLDSQKLAKKLSEVSLCINSSSIENMPNSVAEAMLVGTPVIASYVGGTPEMLNYGEYGFLYNYNEPNILANIIISIFSNQNEAISKANKARIIALRIHSPKQLVDNLLSIYNLTIIDWDCKK
jgi:glycosyltransferase involved in cell wall biosynthesis